MSDLIKTYRIQQKEKLDKAEEQFLQGTDEFLPWAQNVPLSEVAEISVPDKNGPWKNPLYLIITRHHTTMGIANLCKKVQDYVNNMPGGKQILSIKTKIEGNEIVLCTLVRPYGFVPNFDRFYSFIGEKLTAPIKKKKKAQKTGRLIKHGGVRDLTLEQIKEHKKKIEIEKSAYENCSEETPFLNSIDEYELQEPDVTAGSNDMYEVHSMFDDLQLVESKENFMSVFTALMQMANGVEYYNYLNAISGDTTEESFMAFIKQVLQEKYIAAGRFKAEDTDAMMKVMYRSLFELYIIQDMIDDPNITDIKITAPDAVRVRVKGNAYLTNISFLSLDDYKRFVNVIAIRNRILMRVPSQTFTDTRDKNYILRFTVSAAYVNSDNWPILHIRKIARKKLLGEDLIKAGMMDRKVLNYLKDCGKLSKGVVFAGSPGSGKTVALNWFLEEAYEDTAEILVIQENDELFAYRKGIMFQHVVNYTTDQGVAVDLEELGRLALVAGANVFVIGEAKGPEISSAITLANSGCRTAITIHSPSATETIEKMADLALRGYANTKEEAYRSLKCFQTIVYLEHFQIKEITEITGYDEEKKQMIYKPIYRKKD